MIVVAFAFGAWLYFAPKRPPQLWDRDYKRFLSLQSVSGEEIERDGKGQPVRLSSFYISKHGDQRVISVPVQEGKIGNVATVFLRYNYVSQYGEVRLSSNSIKKVKARFYRLPGFVQIWNKVFVPYAPFSATIGGSPVLGVEMTNGPDVRMWDNYITGHEIDLYFNEQNHELLALTTKDSPGGLISILEFRNLRENVDEAPETMTNECVVREARKMISNKIRLEVRNKLLPIR